MFAWFTGITDSKIQFSSLSVVSGQFEMKTALLLGAEVCNSWERSLCLSFLILISGVAMAFVSQRI